MSIIYAKFFSDKRFWIIIISAIVRMGFLGFSYYPQLDDYIQYGVYPFVNSPFVNIFINMGVFVSRPLAGIFDIFVWGKLWGHLGIVLFIITILHAISAYLIIIIADKVRLKIGISFAVFYILCPINSEGTYWISASSRIIVGVFLVCVACYFLVTGRFKTFFIIQFFSMMFYEQVIVFSVIVSILIILYKKFYKAFYGVGFNFIFIATYYLIFAKNDERAYVQFFNLDTISNVFKSWNVQFLINAFIRGLNISSLLYLLLALLVCVLFFEKKKQFDIKLIIVGALIFVLSYVPIIIIKDYTVSLRNCIVPLIGVALIFDNLLNLINFKPYAVCILAFVFIIGFSSELYDYKQNYLCDTKIIEYVTNNLDYTKNNIIIEKKDRYIKTNYDFSEHILSVTAYDWAITGAVRQYTGNYKLKYIRFKPYDTNNKFISLINCTF